MYKEYHALALQIKNLNLGEYLEFGCGDGGFLDFVLAQNSSYKTITAVDINPESVDKAQEKLAGHDIHFIVDKKLPLDLKMNSFSTITLSNTLHHLQNKESVFAELKRLIKPDGEIIITEMISNELARPEQTYCRFHALRAEVDRLHGIFHETTYTANEIQEMISEAGLRIRSKAILLNAKEAVPDKIEVAEMETIIDNLTQAESLRPEFLALEETARSIKAHLRQYGIKRPRQLYLATTTY
ncbi:MAG: class I SAM-dependent methyltransferase [Candidatus Marinimicrobia bacterium]|jgi:ubiquinone/menaquinone biosynthesis C-methylase UbiE|nr:class I SAM-dependent methyltransferase [Candidatus Neomarinimicrobiota bacterium]MBT4359465.1 class I SAM-dependent methyltransferase [Candidatus Neomarinimicrobiota bacterium]MBT4715995.1 class I SAM-dependent methyltransferase [Candidatus Neomarinimicrobiota bacterium]MBT4948072.1 class I SAM-dependent methyltransferase [Candidatus Neomarinimicrobiota bacterium]MBT5270954.1 class I SAM-dependent methyltransferase [Candidatus Neomarinimicrobiota bacterium]